MIQKRYPRRAFLMPLFLVVLLGGAFLSLRHVSRSAKAIPFRAPVGAQSSTVLILSWDGAKPSVLQALLAQRKLPALQSMMDQGCYSLTARTVYPSITLVAHTSMLTGLSPRAHGVCWNDYRPEKGAVGSETVFDAAARAGIGTAMVFGKEKFRHFVKPGVPSCSSYVEGPPPEVESAVERLVREGGRGLIFIHFAEPDRAGHEYGWGNDASGTKPSTEYQQALVACDEATGRILQLPELRQGWSRTLVILTADHGGHDRTHGTEEPEDRTIPWVACGGAVRARGELPDGISVMDTAPTALSALGLSPPAGCEGRVVPCLKVAAQGRPTGVTAPVAVH